MSRYYDANVCRFINVDRQLNTTSLLGYNLFAYCENNPVVRIDPHGDFAITGTAVGYGLAYLCAAVVSTVAGVILAGVISDVLNKLSAIFSRSKTEEIETPKSETEAEEKTEPIITTPSDAPVVFPTNPSDFNPIGLVKINRPGTKNGSIIT